MSNRLQEAAKGRTLADYAFEALANAIVTGEMAAGSRVLEVELSTRFGMSRGPLREAIRRLEERRLVERTVHLGARVVVLSPDVLREVFQMREALEGMACRLAAKHMTDSELAELGALLAVHEGALSTSDIYYQRDRDWDFHYRIARGSGNAMIASTLGGELYQLIKLYRYQHKATPGRARRALAEHRRILGALEDRDGELAELLMRRHIAAARTVVATGIASVTGGPRIDAAGTDHTALQEGDRT